MGNRTEEVVDALRNWWEVKTSRPERLVLAISGGADSVALLRGLLLLAQDHAWAEATEFPDSARWIVAHFNHQVRGIAADEDARWVEQLAKRHSLSFEVGTRVEIATPLILDSEKVLSEGALRDQRLAFLQAAASRHGARHLLLAHHADDQAETVLHHLLRGTSLAGLAGMRTSQEFAGRILVERPLLGLRRETLRSFLSELSQDWREDQTNSENDATRNLLRNRVLPLLKEAIVHMELERDPVESLLQLSRHSRDAQELIETTARELLRISRIEPSGDVARYHVIHWQAQLPVVSREAFRQIWIENNWPRQGLGEQHLMKLTMFLGPYERPLTGDFPGGVRVTRRREWFSIERRVDRL
ncbi:MAG: tRNA lysidine(34) synthetase TilS [Planctomyces sp.]|nr:tRNA lysidine(34) synthetase TilS [Planctomyces sp.]